MFIQPCFIMKNTSEIRSRLELLGYKYIQSIVGNNKEMIFVNNGYFSNNFPYNAMLIDESIDCDTNEDLFLAIAALRDDTDKNQYFKHNSKNHFYKCDMDSFKDYFDDCNKELDDHIEDYHKATVEELIEFFNKKIKI